MSSTSEQVALPAKAGLSRDARVIALVAVAHFTSHIHIMLLPPIFGQVKDAFGVSYIEIGLALTAFNVCGFCPTRSTTPRANSRRFSRLLVGSGGPSSRRSRRFRSAVRIK